MREIVRQSAFKRDYKREKKGKHRGTLDDRLREVLAFLVRDVALPTSFKDHTMGGKWHDCRNCHIKAASCSSTARLTMMGSIWSD